ncbi:hypothetical protein Bca4012_093187 [Brassica carinata]
MSGLDGVEHKTLKVNGINMHVAEIPASGSGRDQIILFIHGFPELWYTWRHQMTALSSLGYRTIAPDLRGYGDTDAPEKVEEYTYLNVVGDLVALIDAVAGGDEAVFLVGHDWGALIAWQLCMYRPEKVKALVNMSVAFSNQDRVPMPTFRRVFGDDYYICRFQRDVPLLDETVVLNGVGHFLHEENPDVINQHIHSFFQKFI